VIIDPDSPLRSSLGESKTDLWYVWAEIAEDHEATAVTARLAAHSMLADAARPFGPLEEEMKASMVSIAASAHSLDAFATAAREAGMVDRDVIAAWKSGGTSRVGQIHQTLCLTFDIGRWSTGWYRDMKWLFDLRGKTVHYEAQWAALERHPLGFDSTRVAATYSLEASRRAVALLLEVLVTCTKQPKAVPTVLLGAGRGRDWPWTSSAGIRIRLCRTIRRDRRVQAAMSREMRS
jgi:hypothetical protein